MPVLLYRCFWNFGFILGTSCCIKWGEAVALLSFFWGSMLLFGFLVVLDPSWPSLGSILEGLDLDFGGFGTPFWDVFVTTWLPYALQCWSFLAVLF